MKRNTFLFLLFALTLGGVWYWRKGTVTAGQAKVLSSSKGKLVDPCPGNDVIWDAETNRCIPLVEEPVPVSASGSGNVNRSLVS